MNQDDELSLRLFIRDKTLDLRDAYQNARDGSPRWAEIDRKQATHGAALARAVSGEDGQAIFSKAMADIKAIAAADLANREAEHRRRREIADSARQFAQQTAYKQAWRERVNRVATTAIDRLIARLNEESSALTGAVDSEAAIRGCLTNIADALTSMKATLDLEVRASVTRENDANKAKAA